MEFCAALSMYVAERSCMEVDLSMENRFHADDVKIAEAFTIQGPPEYSGNILDNPDAVWLEDQWDDDRIEEADQVVQQQSIGVPEFWKQKYFAKAGAYWNTFYVRNKDNFYKDRHYLHVVFPELAPENPISEHIEKCSQSITLLEVGCGGKRSSCTRIYCIYLYFFLLIQFDDSTLVGNAILPLVELNPALRVVAIDFACSAVEILRSHPLYMSTGRVQAFVCDVANDALPVSDSSLNFALCMYVLSAVPPQVKMLYYQPIN